MSINEEAACLDYLVDYLGSDAELQNLANGVWSRSVPKTAPFPAVKIDRLSASDLFGVGLYRVWDDLTYLIRATAKHPGGMGSELDWEEVRAIGDRIDALMHAHEEQTAELHVHSFREESFTDETIEAGDLYLHVGGIYRVRASAV